MCVFLLNIFTFSQSLYCLNIFISIYYGNKSLNTLKLRNILCTMIINELSRHQDTGRNVNDFVILKKP